MCDRKWYKRPTRLSVYLFLWVIQCYKHLFGWKNWISSIFSICPSRNYCIMYNGLIIINHGMMSCSSLLDIYRACLLNDDIILINQFKVFFRFFVFFFCSHQERALNVGERFQQQIFVTNYGPNEEPTKQ